MLLGLFFFCLFYTNSFALSLGHLIWNMRPLSQMHHSLWSLRLTLILVQLHGSTCCSRSRPFPVPAAPLCHSDMFVSPCVSDAAAQALQWGKLKVRTNKHTKSILPWELTLLHSSCLIVISLALARCSVRWRCCEDGCSQDPCRGTHQKQTSPQESVCTCISMCVHSGNGFYFSLFSLVLCLPLCFPFSPLL